MFVLSQQDNALFRGIATVVSIALVMYAIGFAYANRAEAVNVTYVFDLLSTSATSTVSNHTIEFATPSGIAAGKTITITFPAGFNMGSVAFGDIDLSISGASQTIAGAAVGTTWGAARAGQVLTLTNGSATFAANSTSTIKIGTNAVGGVNQITNPATQGSYEINIGGTMADSGHTRVAIVDSVVITATVDTSFNFVVNGFTATGTAINGTSTTGTTSATQLPFGTLTSGNIVTLAQNLTVATNAIHGFVVTAEVDQQLTSSTGADIDAFKDATFGAPQAWATPTTDITNENTWGHWGWTSEDAVTTRTTEFGVNQWEGASTSPVVLFSYNGPADGATAGKGSTTVGFQAEITALQEAGDDYTATLTYIATPTF